MQFAAFHLQLSSTLSSASPTRYNMALPPEQINIKRRREEEPVETLCKCFP